MEIRKCSHMAQIKEIKTAKTLSCEECMKVGGTWVHLRTCQTCGKTLCCDSSPATHMTKHYHETSHPVVISSEPGEEWLWCYVDSLILPY